MMLPFTKTIVGVIAAWGALSHAEDNCKALVPKDPLWAFARVSMDVEEGPTERTVNFSNSCEELDLKGGNDAEHHMNDPTPDKPLEAHEGWRFRFEKYILSLRGPSRITTPTTRGIGKSNVADEYQKQIDLIKEEPNALSRIRAVYDLASKYQGTYQNLDTTEPDYKTPAQILESAKNDGARRVCRDFAALLYWSLQQVRMAPLGGQTFSTSVRVGVISSAQLPLALGAHAWLRVSLGQDTFDLDTTGYPGHFTPLKPRGKDLDENKLAAVHDTCKKIERCLREANNPYKGFGMQPFFLPFPGMGPMWRLPTPMPQMGMPPTGKSPTTD